MYYPYLRGKQYELLALREFSSEHRNCQHIIPIIEPVKNTFNGMRTAIQAMMDNGMKFAVILNPNDGELAREQRNVMDEIPILRQRPECWIPAYLYNNQSIDIIRNSELGNLMVIFRDNVDFSNQAIENLLDSERIAYVVNSQTENRVARRLMNRLNKQVIRLDEKFIPKARNIEYVGSEDEPFTDEYRYYEEDGFVGFSDYLLLPKALADGGSLPMAVVIHLTYERAIPESIVMVMHCCSTTNYDNKNVQLKFFEAAQNALARIEGKFSGSAIEELRRCVDLASPRYPGLGVVKKISMKHHLELMNHILSR